MFEFSSVCVVSGASLELVPVAGSRTSDSFVADSAWYIGAGTAIIGDFGSVRPSSLGGSDLGGVMSIYLHVALLILTFASRIRAVPFSVFFQTFIHVKWRVSLLFS